MTSDASKLRLPVAAVVGLLSVAVAGGGAWAVAAERVSDHQARISKLEAQGDEARVRAQRVDDDIREIRDTLREIRDTMRARR